MTKKRTGLRWGLALCVLTALSILSLGDDTTSTRPDDSMRVPSPIVTGPITGGDRAQALGAIPVADLTKAGYVEGEYFYAGSATAFGQVGTWAADGAWTARPTSKADYKVRMLVRRPAEARRFNGIVVVEWLNVSAQAEAAVDFMQMREELLREGYVWVGLGVQSVGINAPRTGLKSLDPTRYGSLLQPGDAYSYDIFSQGTQALRHPQGIDPMSGLRARKVLATGRSQSAFRLVTYINAVHPLAHLFDGFFVHSRGSSPAPLSDGADGRVPANAHTRIDVDVPVLCLQTEGDLITLRSHLARQDQSPHFRQWEVAGCAHAETPRWVVEVPPPLDLGPGCKDPVNAAPHHAVVKAALHALAQWVLKGIAPKQSPLIELTDPTARDPIARDQYGNAKGGIRLPELEAPTATLNGRANGVGAQQASGTPNFCFLFGLTVPFDKATLSKLYTSHDSYVKLFSKATDAVQREGYWLKPEGELARKAAEQSHIGESSQGAR
ncbi:MAG TPA: alpha/beta hydrolase domain-containing protein [Blastocatellia bacterium]|nr:alpha/beta hydrolase domain-containing protein [Blastocatellia bacterium]